MIPTRQRDHSWRYELWNKDGYTGRNLTGVIDGSLGWEKNQAIKGRGTLNVQENADGPLLNVMVRPVLTIADWGEAPYGLWVPSFPRRNFNEVSWSGPIGLLSREAALTRTSAASVLNDDDDITVTIPHGTVITDWISSALTKAGVTRFAIEASPKTENAPQSYFQGETLLQVINAELQRIGHTSMYSDMDGTLRADAYVLPADRPESFADLRPFDVNGNPILGRVFSMTDDSPSIPNKVRAVGRPVGWLPGQTGVAVNNDPNSPYSVVNRDGDVVEKVYTDVNVLSKAEATSYAHQQLLNLSKDGRKAEIEFLHLPGATINKVVYFNVPRAGEPMFATIDSLTVDTSKTGKSMATLVAITAIQDDSVT